MLTLREKLFPCVPGNNVEDPKGRHLLARQRAEICPSVDLGLDVVIDRSGHGGPVPGPGPGFVIAHREWLLRADEASLYELVMKWHKVRALAMEDPWSGS